MTLGRSTGGAGKMQVVVVTADPAFEEMVRATFGTSQRIELAVLSGALAAVEADIEPGAAAVVVIDLDAAPNEDLQALESLMSREGPRLPVVAVVRSVDAGLARALVQMRLADFLIKPVSPVELVRTCARVAQPEPHWDSRAPDPATSSAPFRVYNIGNHQPVQLMRYIEIIEQCLGRKAQMNFLPLQPGDVPETFADIDDLVRDVGYRPATPIEVGVRRFVEWFCEYYVYPRG